jgi:hypothetical protein
LAASLLKNNPTVAEATLDLADTGEQLILRTAPAGIIIDQTPVVAWAAGEDTAIKRSMERNNLPAAGTDSHDWHSCISASCSDARELYWDAVGDTYGTPGAANLSLDNEQIESVVELTPIDSDHVTFTVGNVSAYTTVQYTVEYTHLVDGVEVTDALTGTEALELGTRTFTSKSLYLGTCSANGETCVTHAPATNVTVTLLLQGPEMTERTVTTTLPTLP